MTGMLRLRENSRNVGGGAFLWGAHHPHCDRHFNHLLWIAGHPLCLGCGCLYSGIFVGLFIGPLLGNIGFESWIALHGALVAPTAIQPFLQAKLFKIVARTLLGVATSSYWLSGVLFTEFPVPRLTAVLMMAIAFAIVLAGLTGLRRRFPADPCRDCPLGRYPTCEWNLPRLLGPIGDAELLRAVETRQFSLSYIENPTRQR